MYRKRLLRSDTEETYVWNSDDTPRTKTRQFLKYRSAKTVKRILVFYNVNISQIKKQAYKTATKKKTRQISKILAGRFVKKYKMKSSLFQTRGFSLRKSQNPKVSKLETKMIVQFYERDDVSRLILGVKRMVTYREIKNQKRIINDILNKSDVWNV